jgi:hypothetical protein
MLETIFGENTPSSSRVNRIRLPDGRNASLQDNTVQQVPKGKERAVEPRVSLVTLGVSDLERTVAFYRDGLGWPKSEVGGDEVAFFKTDGVVIALFPRASFADDAGVDIDDVEHGGFTRFSLAHNVT